ncbi:sulfatase-like hydrolase/transferase [Armatimonas rosea]|uniref:Arylsulfatase A-like enzyme n=1 Tax=Armatimonas rosea TaxID=685828 RepID=A0A7W9W7W9_ARMRO|nr:sulfatase-like hydrolase/transferase [Armatimonas rosea]MBB6052894.1 arylsulfatase A-like enzyme [Armatimonas rosea]
MQTKPNFVLFLTDDQPYNGLSCTSNSVLKSPHVDQLAAEGVLFDKAFVTTAICCCSRASLYTGQHMGRQGVEDFKTPLSAAQWQQTFPALLRKAGYRIHMSDNGTMDGAHGFDGKCLMYEESIHVPLIIRDPRLPRSTHGRRSQMALNIDLAPTILAMAGVPIPKSMQGSDLQPILRNAKAKGRDGLSIGRDDKTAVGDYTSPNPLLGTVMDVKVSTL